MTFERHLSLLEIQSYSFNIIYHLVFAGFSIHWTTPPKTNNPPLQDSGSWKQNDTLSRFLSSTTTTMLNFNWCNVNWSPINLKTNTSKQHRCGCGSPSYTGTLPSTSHGKNRRNGIMFENSTHNHRTFPSKKYYKLGWTNKYYIKYISKSPKTSYHLFFLKYHLACSKHESMRVSAQDSNLCLEDFRCWTNPIGVCPSRFIQDESC